MQVIFHAGANKTGSTAIQNAFFDHAGLLAGQGLIYPAFPGPVPAEHWQLSALHHGLPKPPHVQVRLARHAAAHPEGPALEDRVRAVLQASLAAARRQGGTVLLSTESINNEAGLRALAGFLAQAEITPAILLYLRPPADFFVSNLQHDLRHKFRSGLVSNGYRHLRIAAMMDQVFGAGQVHVRVFARSVLAEGDVVADARAWIAARTGRALPEFGGLVRRNEAISAAGCALLLRLKDRLSRPEAALGRPEAALGRP